jgi:uncharacterized membrane protein YhaH (DUF805 family)
MNWVYLFTSFEGRINRKPYWLGWLVLGSIALVLHLLAYKIEGDRLSAIVDLILTYPEFALMAKRGHDRNTSTWVVGAFFAAAAVMNFFIILGLSGPMDNPHPLFMAFGVPIGLFGLVLFIDFGFRRGTQGPNRFGPDPLAGSPQG